MTELYGVCNDDGAAEIDGQASVFMRARTIDLGCE
jgi:hypothetical protein